MRTGVTVVLPVLSRWRRRSTCAGVHPARINTEALRPGGLIRELHGLVLAGGSAFGLEAATGLMAWLAVRGRGLRRLGGRAFRWLPGRDPVRPVRTAATRTGARQPPYRRSGRGPPPTRRVRRSRPGNAGAGYRGRGRAAQGRAGDVRRRWTKRAASRWAALVAVEVAGLGHHARQPHHVGLAPGSRRGRSAARTRRRRATGDAFETKLGRGAPTRPSGSSRPMPRSTTPYLQRLAVMAGDGTWFAIRPTNAPWMATPCSRWRPGRDAGRSRGGSLRGWG